MLTPVERYTTNEPITFWRFMAEEVRTLGFWGAVAGFLALVGAALAGMYMQIPN